MVCRANSGPKVAGIKDGLTNDSFWKMGWTMPQSMEMSRTHVITNIIALVVGVVLFFLWYSQAQ